MSYVILDKDLDVCGVLDLNGRGCKFYDDVRTTKIADDQGKIWSDTLDISVPYGFDETDYISNGYHLLTEGSDGYTYAYRIYSSIDSAIGATHIKKATSVNLAAWDFTKKIVPANKFAMGNSQDVFEYILRGTGWEINENNFFGDSKPIEITAGQNAMYWVDQQIANFGVEFRAYVEVYNGKIIRKLIDIVQELGESKGYRLDYAQDLTGLTRTTDDSLMYTKLYVYGGNDANNKPISIASVNGNQDYIVDDDANDEHNNGGPYLEGYITNQDITNPGGLLVWGRDTLKAYNHPKHNYLVDIAYLGFMPDLGDHFRVVDFSMMPELTISARVIELSESEANPISNKIIIGEFIDVIAVTPSDIVKLQANAEATATKLQKAIDLKTTFFRQNTEPTTATEGDFWIYSGTDSTIYPTQQFVNGKWVAVQEMKGDQGIPGQKGADGKPTYLHIAYADDANGNGFAQTPGQKAYMGTYVDNVQNDSVNPTDYVWVKIQGPQGPQGPTGLQGLQGELGNQGLQGPQGADGLTSYTHIAYAKTADGSVGFSVGDSYGAVYIGMYVDHTVNDSIDPKKYKWTLIKGADGSQGIQGPVGSDGKTPYLHIAYATNANGTAGFSTTDATGKTYMGTYTDYTSADSTVTTKYRWVLIQGPKGDTGPMGVQGLQGLQGTQGDQGLQGPTGVGSYTHIAYATNNTGSTGFSTSDASGKSYIGIYVDTVLTDSIDPKKYKWTLIKGLDGAQGLQGPVGSDGKTPYLHIAYATNSTGTAGFSITDPSNSTYIGTYTDYSIADSLEATKYKWVKVQGPPGIQGAPGPDGLQGIQGPQGNQGIQGPAGASAYTHIAYATNSTGTTGFSNSNSFGATYIGICIDNTSADSTDPTKYKWSLIKGADGTQGIQGPKGTDGKTPYLHIAYATNSTGTAGFSITDSINKTYIGTYTDYSSADSTVATNYKWTLIKGEQGPTGLQGIQGTQGNQGIQGPAGASSYTHIAYATNSTGTTGFSVGNSIGATYIGMYTDSTQADNTDPTKYKWTLIKGSDGTQGIQGPKGTDGQTPFLHIAYATNATGTAGFSTTDATGKTYIGTYTDYTSADSTVATKYKWALIKGEQGPAGLQGIQGTQGNQGIQGPAGVNSYTHIAYATNSTGTTGFTVSGSVDATYIGMYTDNTQADSTDPTKYKWTLIKGADGSQGIQGPKGTDGQTPYLHIAYATNSTGTAGFSITDAVNKIYIGTYTDYTSADSTVPTKYKWVLFQGPQGTQGVQGPTGLQGIQGPQGNQGIAGTSSYTHIAYATNSTGTAGFSVSSSIGATYIGMYTDSTQADSTDATKYKWTLIKGADGTQGIQGPKGTDGQTPYLHIAYATNSTGTAGFSVTDATGKTYIGTYTDYSSADSTVATKYKWVLIKGDQGPVGLQGIQGTQGNQGIQGPSGTSAYTHIAYATNSTGTAGFSVSNSVGTTYIGMYTDGVQADSTDPTKYKWSLIKGADGSQGIQGPKGTDGQTPYLHIAYATNSTGSTGFSITDTTGKTYIGTYTDYTAADSTVPTKYKWTLIKGDQGPTGLQGIQGTQGNQGIQGPAGASSYTHIAYATNATGTTGFSVSGSDDATYIGMYTDNIQADSTVPTKYKWSLIKGSDGTQGIQGPKGTDGQTPYLHIAYATNSTGSAGFSITDSVNKTYIGTYTDYTAADSTVPTKYKWTLIKGADGAQGPKGDTGPTGLQGIQGSKGDQGIPGPAGTGTYSHIAYATNSTGTAGFSVSSGVGATYIGMYVDSVLTDSTDPTKYKWTLIKGADGSKGIQGDKGTDGQTPYLHIAYATNATGSTGFSITDSTNKTYIGTYTDYSAADSTVATKYKWSLIKGSDGATGKGISSVVEYYLASTANSGVTTATTGWSTTFPTLSPTIKYLWNYRKMTYTDSSVVNTTPGVIGAYGEQGLQGNKGDQGIKGIDGAAKYTWVKYADDQYGGNMTDASIGKRYLGLAYNQTTATESTSASAYTWSALYDNVSIGSRNFILNSYYTWSQVGTLTTAYFPPAEAAITLSADFVTELNKTGKLALSLLYKTTNVVWGTSNPWTGYQLAVTYTDGTMSYLDCGGSKVFQVNTGKFVQQINYHNIVAGKTVSTVTIMVLVRDCTGTVEMRQLKAEVGNLVTGWSPAPEDIQTQLDNKAEGSDLDELAGAVSKVRAGLNEKANAGDFGALKEAYDAYLEQAAIDAQTVVDSLATMDGRVALAETLVGDAKLVTDFINTVITESEEGIYIANHNSSTGILIASDRISFMDNGVEVAYINNQTMQINHGIFVESAVIANFNFELIPGSTILSIAWVGD